MITIQEAKQISDEFYDLEIKIKDRGYRGKYHLLVESKLSNGQLELLKKRGFFVRVFSNRILWDSKIYQSLIYWGEVDFSIVNCTSDSNLVLFVEDEL